MDKSVKLVAAGPAATGALLRASRWLMLMAGLGGMTWAQAGWEEGPGAATAAAVVQAAPQPASAPDAQALSDPAWISAGRKRFISACAYCHGQQGESGKVKSFKERPGWDPTAIHQVIANGRVRSGNVMPAWKDSLKDDEIWQIVAYIKSLTPLTPETQGASQ